MLRFKLGNGTRLFTLSVKQLWTRHIHVTMSRVQGSKVLFYFLFINKKSFNLVWHISFGKIINIMANEHVAQLTVFPSKMFRPRTSSL
jgi:hypothetical protein